MEKLKVKHDHTLTDILKVGIFGLFLILPILMFLPNCLYYAFNENAQVNTSTQPVYEYKNVNFNQLVQPNYSSGTISINGVDFIPNGKGTLHIEGEATNDSVYTIYNMELSFNVVQDNKYYVKIKNNYSSASGLNYGIYLGSWFGFTENSIFTAQGGNSSSNQWWVRVPNELQIDIDLQPQIFNLTQMFGSGNEPTMQQFDEWYSEDYYSYTLSKKEILEIETEDTVTVTETTKNIEYAWKSLWEGPILTWTNNNNFIFTINLFTQIFAVSQESYLTNYLTYILTITAIYLIFDIVFVLITKLTHLINSK